MSLSDAVNLHYSNHAADWTLAREFYSGDVSSSRLQKGHFESKSTFQQRRKRAHIFPYTRQIISRLSDQILLRADEVGRETGPVPDAFFAAAGASGESHDLVMKKLGDYLLLYGEAWLQVLPRPGGARLRVLTPLSAPRYSDRFVMVKGERTFSDSPFEKEKSLTTYTIHTASQWVTYVEDKEAPEKRREIDRGSYASEGTDTYFVGEGGEPMPPFVRVQMPWDAVLGVELAKTHLEMFRLESQIDARLHTSLTSSQAVTYGLSEDQQTAVDKAMQKGANMLHLGSSPSDAAIESFDVPVDATEMAETRLEKKETRLYETAYQTLAGAEAGASATEMVVKDKAAAAATATLAATIQSAEQSALRLVAQAGDMIQYGGPAAGDPEIGYARSWTDIDWQSAGVDLE